MKKLLILLLALMTNAQVMAMPTANRTILDNGEFLREVTGLPTLLYELTKAHPELGVEILMDLSQVNYFISDKGNPQVASRGGDDVIFSRYHLNSPDLAYVVIRESLRKLLKNNDDKVINVINYLKDNETPYKPMSIKQLLEKNGYKAEIRTQYRFKTNSIKSTAANLFLAKAYTEAERLIECANTRVSMNHFEPKVKAFLKSFNQQSCENAKDELQRFFNEEVFRSKADNWFAVMESGITPFAPFTSSIHDPSDKISRLTLPELRFFQRTEKRHQKRLCSQNDRKLSNAQRLKPNYVERVKAKKEFDQFLQTNQDLEEDHLNILKSYLSYTEEVNEFSLTTLKRILESEVNGLKNQQLCQYRYPKGYSDED